MESKPIIGVTPLYDAERESIWMLPGYVDALKDCGALPLILPFTWTDSDVAQLVGMCDGILFTGGQDVDPALYQTKRSPQCGAVNAERDKMEYAFLQRALLLDMPVLGICRGAQFINVCLGGTLYQDIPSEMQLSVAHMMVHPYNHACHDVTLEPGTPLYYLLKQTSLQVNSIHHQGIRELSFQLSPMAYAPDGLIEAFYHPMKGFTWGVQWHPEYLWREDTDERQIFQAFVDACARNAAGQAPAATGRARQKGAPFLARR